MIPFFDPRRAVAELRPALDAAYARVLDSRRLILGEEVEAFEREFAAFVGAEHCVGVNSGTDALILALRAAGVGAGDEVLTTANSGVPTVSAIRAVGARPRFVDVDPATLLLDVRALEDAATPACRAVIPVHLYGQTVPLDPLLRFAADRGLTVIEDCAQAHGAIWNGAHAGTFGRFGCFSFYPTKNLGALGDGGAVVTNDAADAQAIRERRMYGYRDDAHAHVEGLNSRLDELQAAFLRVRLDALPGRLRRRRELAALYRDELDGAPYVPTATLPGAEHAWHLLVVRPREGVRAPLRAALRATLAERGLQTGVHYAEPVHRMEAYRFLEVPAGALPVTERACAEVVSLPLFDGLTDDEVRRAAGILRDTLARARG